MFSDLKGDQGLRTSRNITEGQRAVRRLVAISVVAVTLILLGAGALLAFTARAVDELQLREERSLVARNLARSLETVASDVTTASVWDQAYDEFRPGGDIDWADQEIGTYFVHNRGHDRVLAVDTGDAPFYAWSGPSRVAVGQLARFHADIRPLIDQVRAIERLKQAPRQIAGPTDPSLAHLASGVVRSEGVYYLVAASTVTPETLEAARRPGPAVVVVSAQRLNRQTVSLLRDELHVRDPKIVADTRAQANAVLLRDAAGRPLGSLTWTPRRPGLSVLRNAAPLFLAGLAILVAAAVAVGLIVRSIARKIDAHELAHGRAMEDLTRARDQAQSANLAKSQFLANMSHEIRTPLNGILGMAQVMARSGLGPPHTERLQIIRDSGETLLAVLNDLLDLSKIEAGRLDLDPHAFDLEAAVSAACKPLAHLAEQKDVAFRLRVDPDLRGAWIGDSVRLRQVLSNLVSNAVKFTAAGEVSVTVAPTVGGVVFAVRDSGIGIPADRLPLLFEKFVQADATTTRRFGGTGLGLAICRELVQLMSGGLRVESVEGEGSTFSFELPLARAEADASRADFSAEAAPSEGAPLRILAAEDNRTNQLLLKALLEPLGVELHIVADGREAVDAFSADHYDLVLMDVQMPNMNGVEATAAIRMLEQAEGRERTPILALSANVMSHQTSEYLAIGMDGCVAKPIDAQALFAAINRIGESRASRSEAAAA